ncbi:hypothetical protein [Horticoccus sp. 23ND18S-11]|uniref:hypothetical protein n=1 Tax=Horticoccus sp. 23ND18S-11 TaxID=3391832 RepID=UPI0039C94AAB
MKVFERQTIGYGADCLASFFRSTLFPSPFFDQPAPVRGICFASGDNALEEARTLAEQTLNVGTIVIRTGDMTPDRWRDLLHTLSPPTLTLSRVALIVPNVDRVAPATQEKIANALLATPPGVPWLITVSDHRKLDAGLTLGLLVYLGLGPNGRMRFLSQSGQHLMIDYGSLQRP